MGINIYFTDKEILQLINYVSESVSTLGEAEDTRQQAEEDLNDSLGSAMYKLYKGTICEKIYEKYKK